MKAVVEVFDSNSMCTALVVMHTKRLVDNLLEESLDSDNVVLVS